jgi:hypothetical protein
MLNISPVGRDCSFPEREAFEIYDKEHHIRQKFVQAIKDKFPDVPIEMAIGGQISFDLFPKVIIFYLEISPVRVGTRPTVCVIWKVIRISISLETSATQGAMTTRSMAATGSKKATR